LKRPVAIRLLAACGLSLMEAMLKAAMCRVFNRLAFSATIIAELAFAGNRLRRQRGRAFQASSPKLSKAGVFAGLFLCARGLVLRRHRAAVATQIVLLIAFALSLGAAWRQFEHVLIARQQGLAGGR
jgi:lysylphosphatidylglycerol synthetase-like protein (DUF2156 family)